MTSSAPKRKVLWLSNRGYPVFAGAGERTREGNDFYREMEESKGLDKVAMVFGQMNEPPGNRLRVALTGLTMAEKFRDEGRDILLFIDNIYRYTLAVARARKIQRFRAGALLVRTGRSLIGAQPIGWRALTASPSPPDRWRESAGSPTGL